MDTSDSLEVCKGIGDWVLGIRYWVLGIGDWALGKISQSLVTSP
ncbi:MAG: hypothetical protein V7L11_07025 [Nostoc sp.]